MPSGDVPQPSGAPLPRSLRLLLIAVIALFFCGLALSGGLLYLHYHTPMPTLPLGTGPVAPAPTTDTIHPFNLVDQDNKPVKRDILQNKITVLQFMFTSCPMVCPTMTNQMANLQKRLKGIPGIQFVSISFDPAHDTPAVLKQYAASRSLDESNWRFLTDPVGSHAGTARSIYQNDLHQMLEDKPESVIKATDGSDMPNINHSVNLFLVAPDGTVIGIYNSLHPDEMNNLATHALQASKQLK